MTFGENEFENERWQLPASTWWIPSLTALVVLLAIATAIA
jgi:hypothetical protein